MSDKPKCPKCGSENYKTPWPRQGTHHCYDCGIFYTDWQAAEIEALKEEIRGLRIALKELRELTTVYGR